MNLKIQAAGLCLVLFFGTLVGTVAIAWTMRSQQGKAFIKMPRLALTPRIGQSTGRLRVYVDYGTHYRGKEAYHCLSALTDEARKHVFPQERKPPVLSPDFGNPNNRKLCTVCFPK
jgi:hypothetical protein